MFDYEPFKSDLVLVTFAWLAFGKVLLGLSFDRLLRRAAAREHRVFRVPIPAGQALREMTTSWHVVSDALVLAVLMATHAIRLLPSTPASVGVTFVIFYLWVETYYYFGHRLMHKSRFLYQFHRTHHLSKVITPLSSISMSLFEKTFLYTCGWLGFMCLVSWVCPVSLGGIALYYTYHFAISLHGHSNTEASSHGLVFAKLGLGSATSHALHHARPSVNYGFSNLFWDRILGTYDPQTLSLQKRAVARNGASELHARAQLRTDPERASLPFHG